MKQRPYIAIYNGQSLAPPDRGGLTAGSGLWCQIGCDWYRVEHTSSILKLAKKMIKSLELRKWPFNEN